MTRRILLDGLRRPAVAVLPFDDRDDPSNATSRDLILVDLEPGRADADLLATLRDAMAAREPSGIHRRTE